MENPTAMQTAETIILDVFNILFTEEKKIIGADLKTLNQFRNDVLEQTIAYLSHSPFLAKKR